MRFSVTFCALLLVTTTGIAQADSSKPVKTAGNNRADSAENATAALDATLNPLSPYRLSLENADPGKGVDFARNMARKYDFLQSSDPRNPGRIAFSSQHSVRLFVGTPNGNRQTVISSAVNSFPDKTVESIATLISLNPATGKLISVTNCQTPRDNKGSCLTVTRKTCDAIFPESHLRSQKLAKIQECGKLLLGMQTFDHFDPLVEAANIAQMKSIRPGLRLAAKQGDSRHTIDELAQSYLSLAYVISLCHKAGGGERFVKVSNPQSQNKSSGLSEEAK
jgi:hypothetical protein